MPGAPLPVVAAEVKGLANDTRKATEEIAHTIDALGGEAEMVIGRIEAGARASGEAKALGRADRKHEWRASAIWSKRLTSRTMSSPVRPARSAGMSTRCSAC